jgi:hypothetical protein
MHALKKGALCAAFLFAGLTSCHKSGAIAPVSVTELKNPAPQGSVAPKLTMNARGEFLMAWIEPGENGTASLEFAAYDGKGWSESGRAISGKLNTEEFASPIIAQTKSGAYTAFWTELLSENPWKEFAYTSASSDGRNWTPPRILHRDESASEHSFLSAAQTGDDAVQVVWLDGRETAGAPYPAGHYHLMTTAVGKSGEPQPERLLDDNVCTCCPTAIEPFEHGYVVAYRDRTADEIRDMSIIKVSNGQASAPISVHQDGWRINGCPTNGPAIAVNQDLVAVAWYTAANDQPKLLMTSSTHLAEGFRPPIQIDMGHPKGRPALAPQSDGAILAVWEEKSGNSTALFARRVTADLKISSPTPISEKVSGFPSLKSSGPVVALAYYQKRDGKGVIRTALLR